MLKKVLLALLLLGLGIAVGYWATPSKVIEKEKIVYVDKIVEKIVHDQNKDQKNNKVTIRLVTIKPDGTKTIETKIFDKTEIEVTTHSSVDKVEETTTTTEKEKTVEYSKNDWLISVGLDSNMSYGGLVSKRFLGPIYLGGFLFTDRTFGATLGVSW